uniref:Uncharacterized protein n=1 Tax=Globodera rostochiensis TaxID=31243 RepID=A0A914I449_GLORO
MSGAEENAAIPPATGSDFDPMFFKSEENQNWRNVLTQMRVFESAVCRQFRKMEKEINEMANRPPNTEVIGRINGLETSVIELENTEETDHFQVEEQLIRVEEKVDQMQTRHESFEKLTKVKFSKMIEKVKGEADKVQRQIEVLRGRVELLEWENESIGNEWMENGHAFEHEQLPGGEEGPRGEGEQKSQSESETPEGAMHQKQLECEIMVTDPFLGGITPMESYDRQSQHFFLALGF